MLIPFKELWARNKIKANDVLHLGSSVGQERFAYAQLGVHNVVWVEALPDVFAQLEANIKNFPGNIALQACLSDKDGEVVQFHVANNEGQSSSFLEFGTHAQEHPTTKFTHSIGMVTVRLDTLLFRNRIEIKDGSFLNVDLQGAELLALKGMGALLSLFNYAYVEVNKKHLYKGCPLVGEVDDYLKEFGLLPKETKWMKQGWGDRYYERILGNDQ